MTALPEPTGVLGHLRYTRALMRWFGDWRGRIDSADAELSAAVDARDEALVALGERAVDPTACDLPLARRFAETHAALARRGEEAAARLGMLSESAAQAEADLAAAKTVDGAPPDEEALALRHARDELQRGLGAARRQVDQLAAQRRAALADLGRALLAGRAEPLGADLQSLRAQAAQATAACDALRRERSGLLGERLGVDPKPALRTLAAFTLIALALALAWAL